MKENSIQVKIAGRVYSPNVKKEEEERVRQAAGLINERMDIFEKTYAVKDKQDLLAMCCLQFATQSLEPRDTGTNHPESVSEKIIALDKFISEHLDKEK
jgi:cell division protein ZapA